MLKNMERQKKSLVGQLRRIFKTQSLSVEDPQNSTVEVACFRGQADLAIAVQVLACDPAGIRRPLTIPSDNITDAIRYCRNWIPASLSPLHMSA